MKQNTAMMELIDELSCKSSGMSIYLNAHKSIIEKYIQKEEEQIKQAHGIGYNDGLADNGTLSEEYFNQTYNN